MAEENQNQENSNKPAPKSKLTLILIIIIALLLAGGGYMAYTMFMAPTSPTPEQPADKPVNQATPVGEIPNLEPFVVNLADPRGKRYLKLKLSLELETPQAAEKAQRLAPKLRDTVIMMTTSLSFEEVMTPEGKLRIRDELQERFNRALRPDKIRNIYFSEFVIQ